MRRLPQDRMLDVVLERGAATITMMEALAERLTAFHGFAATGPGVDEYGSPAAVWANAVENFGQTRPFIGRTIDARTWALVRSSSQRFLEENLALFERRVAQGRIRDGHGDLHAANICMTEPIAIFDCIEFDDRSRCGDVAAEVAFLAMDLEYRGRADLATSFVDRYVEASGDRGLRDLLDFDICYRAYVRGKVESLKLDEPGFSAAEYGTTPTQARRSFDLARSYAIRLARTWGKAVSSVA
jgi:aminoglycoside phosphotransferase family enzyme